MDAAHTNPSVLDRLCSPDTTLFEAALVEFRRLSPRNGAAAGTYVLGALNSLAITSWLDTLEKRRRCDVILSRTEMVTELCEQLASAAPSFPAEVRNAIASVLPSRFKALVYGRPATHSIEIDASAQIAKNVVARSFANAVRDQHRGVVLLLGSHNDHQHNMRLLQKEGFVSQRPKSMEEMAAIQDDDICAIVVAASWWKNLAPDKHRAAIDALLSYSSFVWLKVNTQALQDADMHELFKLSRFREPKAVELQLSHSHDLVQPDISLLRSSFALCQDTVQTHLYPSEISSEDAKLIAGATKVYLQSHNTADEDPLSSVSTRMLPGGRSGSQLVHISCDGRIPPFVAKIDKKERLGEELKRFQTYIAPIDGESRPQLHFRHSRGAILFSLVSNADDTSQAAPTLWDVLSDALYSECGGDVEITVPANLEKLLSRVVDKLHKLNSRHPPETDTIPSRMWDSLQTISSLKAAKISWNLISLVDGTQPLDLCEEARECIRELNQVSTVHGDVHLRNILVRDSIPHLIDFASAGPGHPCFDLVRLECAILFHAFRMTDSEEVVRQLLLELGAGAPYADIARKFPTLCQSMGNKLSIFTAIKVRETCLKLLDDKGWERKQFHAMQMVIAAQSLAMLELQSGIARASVSAAAELFKQHLNGSAQR